MSYLDDPRVFFAAERTLLAWQRTAIATIGLALVIERFGLFVRFMTGTKLGAAGGTVGNTQVTSVVALVFLVAGACVALISIRQYQRVLSALGEQEVPRGYMTWPGPAMNGLLAATALGSAVWMIVCE